MNGTVLSLQGAVFSERCMCWELMWALPLHWVTKMYYSDLIESVMRTEIWQKIETRDVRLREMCCYISDTEVMFSVN